MRSGPGGGRRWWGRMAFFNDDELDKPPVPEVALIALLVVLVGVALLVWATF